MPTFARSDEGGRRFLRLYDHSEGKWDPRGANDPWVAGVQFHGLEVFEDEPSNHFVVHHSPPSTILEAVLDPANVPEEAVVLQCSSEASGVPEPHLARPGDRSFVVLRKKDRQAFEDVERWLPAFLSLDFETAVRIAEVDVRKEELAFEAEYGGLLDVVWPRSATEVLPALSVLCQGWLAVWAARREDMVETLNADRNELMGAALGVMGWRSELRSLLASDLSNKLSDVSAREWWKECFGPSAIAPLVEKELKGRLSETQSLRSLVKWIDEGNLAEDFEHIVAGAYLDISDEAEGS